MGNRRLCSTLGSYLVPNQFLDPLAGSKKDIRNEKVSSSYLCFCPNRLVLNFGLCPGFLFSIFIIHVALVFPCLGFSAYMAAFLSTYLKYCFQGFLSTYSRGYKNRAIAKKMLEISPILNDDKECQLFKFMTFFDSRKDLTS
jgi:hypothetical protein